MKRVLLSILIILCLAGVSMAQTYVWRYRTHATDCTALTDGKVTDLCYEQNSQKLYKCVPSAGDCSGSEWKQTSSFLTGNDTEVLFFDGANNPSGDAGLYYAKASDLLDVVGGLRVSDGTDKAIDALTINRASTDAKLAWDETNDRFTLNYPLYISGSSGSVFLPEQAAADTDEAGYGQIWVKNETPNQLWFTNDAGTDFQVGGAVNSSDINWESLQDVQSADINWTNVKDLQAISSSAINWQNLEELANGNINWNTVNLGSTFAMPSGTNPTIDGAGEIAIDTTSDHIEYYGGAKRVVGYQRQFCFALEDPVDADDDVPIYFPREPITITDVYCEVDGGTSVALTISDGTNALEAITCDADGAEDDGSIANGTFTANERMEFDLGSSSGTNTWLAGCVTYTLTED